MKSYLERREQFQNYYFKCWFYNLTIINNKCIYNPRNEMITPQSKIYIKHNITTIEKFFYIPQFSDTFLHFGGIESLCDQA